jgi:FMN reductase
MSREIVIFSGSPSATSRSTFVASVVASHAEHAGWSPRFWSLDDFDPADVLRAQAGAPAIARMISSVKSAVAVVLSTPVYKAAYAGGLKALVDLIPADALVGKPALGVATTKLEAHGLEVDRAFRSLFAFFRARLVDTLVVLDAELALDSDVPTLTAPAQHRVARAAERLVLEAEGTAQAVREP